MLIGSALPCLLRGRDGGVGNEPFVNIAPLVDRLRCSPRPPLPREPATQANPKLQAEAERVQQLDLVLGDVTPQTGRDVRKLWEDDGLQRVWANKARTVCRGLLLLSGYTAVFERRAPRFARDAFVLRCCCCCSCSAAAAVIVVVGRMYIGGTVSDI